MSSRREFLTQTTAAVVAATSIQVARGAEDRGLAQKSR
jgi:hypothetical protein